MPLSVKNLVDFTGGLNFVDSELNMRERYLTQALNCELGYDSTIKKRNGFKLVKNITEFLIENEVIQEIFYFALRVIIYTNKGRVLTLDEQNNVEVIWDTSKAEALETTIWNHPTERCFGAIAQNMFILSNGYDKPLQICYDLDVVCQYLHDPATGSNANTPVIYKCKMVNHYLCAITLNDDLLHISAKDAAGVWTGDDGAEDAGAQQMKISSIIELDTQRLLDVFSFKNLVGVMSDYYIILIGLDQYSEKPDPTDGTKTISYHNPYVEVVIDNAGCATVGSTQLTYDSVVFLSANGINSVQRNVISQNFIPESLSNKILPYIKSKLTKELLDDGCHSVVDRQRFVYYIKFADNTLLCMSFHPNLSEPCFYVWDNIKYVSFTSNIFGRVLATDGYGIMIYSEDADGYCKDDYIDKNTKSLSSETFNFAVTTPWLNYGSPNNVKTMEYVNVVSDGLAKFYLSASFDLKTEQELSIGLVGGSMLGFGSQYNPHFGGGIITSNEQLIDYSQVFMFNKFSMTSSDEKPLRIIRLGVSLKTGGIRR